MGGRKCAHTAAQQGGPQPTARQLGEHPPVLEEMHHQIDARSHNRSHSAQKRHDHEGLIEHNTTPQTQCSVQVRPSHFRFRPVRMKVPLDPYSQYYPNILRIAPIFPDTLNVQLLFCAIDPLVRQIAEQLGPAQRLT